MNSAERVFAALNGNQPDRVPYGELAIDAKVIDKIKPGMQYEDFVDYADIDIVACYTMVEPPERISWIDEGRGLWRDKWGAVQKCHGEVISVLQGPAVIDSFEDLRDYSPPDADSASVIHKAQQLVERFGAKRAVAVAGEAVFAPLQYMRAGLQNLSLDFYDRPGLVRGMAEIAAGYHCKLYRKLVETGVKIVILGDDFCHKSGSLISPEHIREFILPGLKEVVKAVKDSGGYCIKHTDGDAYDIISVFKEAGVDMLGPLESPYMDLREVRDGHDIGVMGNINMDLLARGTHRGVEEAVKSLIDDVAPGGRFILSSGNTISSAVRPENFMAMLETCRTYRPRQNYSLKES